MKCSHCPGAAASFEPNILEMFHDPRVRTRSSRATWYVAATREAGSKRCPCLYWPESTTGQGTRRLVASQVRWPHCDWERDVRHHCINV